MTTQLNIGIDIDSYNIGFTPLYISLIYLHEKCAIYLLEQMANPNAMIKHQMSVKKLIQNFIDGGHTN